MSTHWTDEEITAYALDEMPRALRRRFEVDIDRDSELAAQLDRIWSLSRELQNGDGKQPPLALSNTQRERVVSAIVARDPFEKLPIRPWQVAVGIAAACVIVLLSFFGPKPPPTAPRNETLTFSAGTPPIEPTVNSGPALALAPPLRLHGAYEDREVVKARFKDPTGQSVTLSVGEHWGAYVLDAVNVSSGIAVFRHVETGGNFRLYLDEPSAEVEVRLLRVNETPRGWTAYIQTGPRIRKWYNEGDKFETFELMGINPGSGCVEMFNEETDEFFTICIEVDPPIESN